MKEGSGGRDEMKLLNFLKEGGDGLDRPPGQAADASNIEI